MPTQYVRIRPIPKREGVAHILIAAMLAVLVTMAGVTINIAYMQLLRTQQKVAVDLAAKAAVEALVRTGSQSQAESAAETIAGYHKVGTSNLTIVDSRIDFGNSTEQSNGSFDFKVGQTPVNSARIISTFGDPGETPPVAMFFPSLKHKKYTGSVTSVSTYLMNEVVLCLDRSGSMKFDMTGTDWSYAPNNPYVPDPNFDNNYDGRPHPNDSRWAKLVGAIDVFLAEAELSVNPPRVGLVTWSNNDNASGVSTVEYALPAMGVAWTENKDAITGALAARSSGTNNAGVFGGTQMKLGMEAGLLALQTVNAHEMANRVMVVLTDGQYQGDDPFVVAQAAADLGITIHCISLLAGDTYTMAQNIAQETGGDAYMATNAQQLEDAFAEIARSLNVVLTQ